MENANFNSQSKRNNSRPKIKFTTDFFTKKFNEIIRQLIEKFYLLSFFLLVFFPSIKSNQSMEEKNYAKNSKNTQSTSENNETSYKITTITTAVTTNKNWFHWNVNWQVVKKTPSGGRCSGKHVAAYSCLSAALIVVAVIAFTLSFFFLFLRFPLLLTVAERKKSQSRRRSRGRGRISAQVGVWRGRVSDRWPLAGGSRKFSVNFN